MLYDIVLDRIKKNKQTKHEGKFVGVPFPFEMLQEYYPAFNMGDSIGVLAGTGVGKSSLLRYLFVYYLYDFYKRTGYNLRILYFALEDSPQRVYDYFVCNYLFKVHDIEITPSELNSKGDNRELPDFIVDALEQGREYFSDFEKVVSVIDGYSTPKQMFETLKDYANRTGTIKDFTVDINGKQENQSLYESDIHTFVLIDNLSNVDKDDEHSSERQAVVELAKDYIREELCNYYRFTVIQLLQLDFATERQQYSSNGKSIIGKVEPTLAGIGDAKTVSRSMHIIFTLFDPSRYDLIRYPQVNESNAHKAYDIDLLGDKFRSLKIIKNNDGATGKRIGLLMNPLSGEFNALPKPDSEEMSKIYSDLKKKDSRYSKSNTNIKYVNTGTSRNRQSVESDEPLESPF